MQIHLVECKALNIKEAYLNLFTAEKRARDLVFELKNATYFDPDVFEIDFERLGGPKSSPVDNFELTIQWNEFWEDEEEYQILIISLAVA
jgi:hypothetical protein